MMKIAFVIFLYIFVIKAEAWQHNREVRNPLEFFAPTTNNYHTVTDCMYVTSEEGDFIYRKHGRLAAKTPQGVRILEVDPTDPTVCGVYFMTDPNKVVEITVKYLDVSCEFGGLVGFVDGWELNGEYFPGVRDHQLNLEERVTEFCNKQQFFGKQFNRKRRFVSNQNAALFQYKIPVSGSFVISARYLHNPKPCHIMAEGLAPYYTLQNYGLRNNCTLSALFPAVVSILDIDVGSNKQTVSYDCDQENVHDKVDIGGSSGLDSMNLFKASTVCGKSDAKGPEQAIFCGTTTVRLESSGKFNNKVLVELRQATESDIDLATAVCDL